MISDLFNNISISLEATILWLPELVLWFVCLLFDIHYIEPSIRRLIVGFIAFVLYLHALQAIIALFQKWLGFRPTGRD